MKAFMDEDFLLTTDAAKTLFHDYAESMPIIDYHCHINPADIANDRTYSTISEVWLGGDHYKWRAMRWAGVAESDITGAISSDPYRVFSSWAKTLPKLIGNPLYHWTYLELKKYFGITKALNPASCREIYDACNEKLRRPEMSARGMIRQSNVKLICTTDDPIDDLRYHKQIAADSDVEFKVLPAFRPDRALNIDKPGFADYIAKLEEVSGIRLTSFDAVCRALDARIEYFHANGCRVSDHALDAPVFAEATPAELDSLLELALQAPVTPAQAEPFKTALLRHLARRYSELGWAMQIHYGCIRNISSTMYEKLGPDTGYDAIGDNAIGGSDGNVSKLAQLLDCFQKGGCLPKMVIYSLNQYDNEKIATIAGAFQDDPACAGKIQLGAAWWFNDTLSGMTKQLTDYANLGALASFVGMLTDSRSFLSYTRHEYFRRILCNLLGGWLENGMYNDDIETLGGIVKDISYSNAVKYFGFEL